MCTGHVFLLKGICFPFDISLLTSADSGLGYYFREPETSEAVDELENEDAASDSDKLSVEESSEWEVGHVRGNPAGKSTQSPDPELNEEANYNDTNHFEDMLDYAPMPVDDQVRSLK